MIDTKPYPVPLAMIQHPENGGLLEILRGLATTGRFFYVEDLPCMLSSDGRQVQGLRDAEMVGASLTCGHVLRVVENDGGGIPAEAHRRNLGRSILSTLASYPGTWPNVETVAHAPVWHVIGDHLEPAPSGLNVVSRELVLAADLPAVMPAVDPAYPHLHRLFSGLTMIDDVYRGNLLGLLCAMFTRTGIREFPIVLLDAAAKSSGKTATASALGMVLTGREVKPITYSGTEHEFEVRLGTYAHAPGPHVVHVDNVRAKQGSVSRIRSQVMSAAVHTHATKVRKLHEGVAPLFDPIFIITMNGARVEGDLADKSVIMCLHRPASVDVHRPLIPHPLEYAREHRLAIVAEVYSVLSKIKLPAITEDRLHTRFYRFEQIMRESAKMLGIEASLAPDRVRVADICVDELLNLLADEFPGQTQVELRSVFEMLEAQPGVRELNEIMSAASRSRKGRQVAFSEYLETNMHRHTYKWRGKVVTLQIIDGQIRLLTPVV